MKTAFAYANVGFVRKVTDFMDRPIYDNLEEEV
jgi:hypothetical protein